jgi:methylated-DNA-[protein]-cysteine S-methyltransferase
MRYTTIDSPIGELLLAGGEHGLQRLWMSPFRVQPTWTYDPDMFADVHDQLDQYFAGERYEFDVLLDLHGNGFELSVWDALLAIPYGETASYGEIARRIGAPTAARAVGMANGRNPVAVIVPCHRVIGADGSLTGYGGGIERKRFLLELEAGVLPLSA